MFPANFNCSILDGWLSRGFCNGAGNGTDSVCVEQAVALSLGIELTDYPEKHPDSCIEPKIAQIERSINDMYWSSNKARANGLRDLAYEQLGSKGIDEPWLKNRLSELLIRKLVPMVFRKVAESLPTLHKDEFLTRADACQSLGTQEAAACAASTAWAAWTARAASAARATLAAGAAGAAMAACAASAAGAAEFPDQFAILVSDLTLQALREAKTKAGLPLFYDLFPKETSCSPSV